MIKYPEPLEASYVKTTVLLMETYTEYTETFTYYLETLLLNKHIDVELLYPEVKSEMKWEEWHIWMSTAIKVADYILFRPNQGESLGIQILYAMAISLGKPIIVYDRAGLICDEEAEIPVFITDSEDKLLNHLRTL